MYYTRVRVNWQSLRGATLVLSTNSIRAYVGLAVGSTRVRYYGVARLIFSLSADGMLSRLHVTILREIYDRFYDVFSHSRNVYGG